jgi:UDPglucose--hexose-1-phosphate uridylyltransferase
MGAGLFELRKDNITGWWVATVVDRQFQRGRFSLAAAAIEDEPCQNCSQPPGDGVRLRILKDYAFNVVGTEGEARAVERNLAQVAMAQARASGSWRTIVAPPGEHRPLHMVGGEMLRTMLGEARKAIVESQRVGQTEYLQVVQNWGAQAGARTNHLCLDLYDLPQIPHRVAEEIGGAARFMVREGECPYCRLAREEPRVGTRMIWQDDSNVAFAPYASRSPFEVWIVPRRHAADFGSAADTDIASTAEALRQVLGRLACLDGPPHNLVLHTAPLRERVDGKSTRGFARSPDWKWGRACRSTRSRLRKPLRSCCATGLPGETLSCHEALGTGARASQVRRRARQTLSARGDALSDFYPYISGGI